MALGMVPVREFLWRSRISNFVKAATLLGMKPLRELTDSKRTINDFSALIEPGIVPTREFLWMSRVTSVVNALIVLGIVPPILFPFRTKEDMLWKLPIVNGKVPLMSTDVREISDTLA